MKINNLITLLLFLILFSAHVWAATYPCKQILTEVTATAPQKASTQDLRVAIYQNKMRDYLDEASEKGKLREGLAGKSFSEIRESPEFLKAYDAYADAEKVKSLPLEEREQALSKFAAEWIYPPKDAVSSNTSQPLANQGSPVTQTQMAIAAQGKPQVDFVKDAPIIGYQIKSTKFEDIPLAIRKHMGSEDQTTYTPEYLAQNKDSIIALQMNGDKPDFYIVGKDTFASKYKTVDLSNVQEKNPKLVTKLKDVEGIGDILQDNTGIVGALKTVPVKMVRMSAMGYPVDKPATIESPWGLQTKPQGQDAFLVFDSSKNQYYMVNVGSDGNPIGYIPTGNN